VRESRRFKESGVHLWRRRLIAFGDAMERSASATEVMLIDEVARALKITPKQIRRLERRGLPDSATAKARPPSALRSLPGRALRSRRSTAAYDASSPHRLVQTASPAPNYAAPECSTQDEAGPRFVDSLKRVGTPGPDSPALGLAGVSAQ
jgi:hypothetical protein